MRCYRALSPGASARVLDAHADGRTYAEVETRPDGWVARRPRKRVEKPGVTGEREGQGWVVFFLRRGGVETGGYKATAWGRSGVAAGYRGRWCVQDGARWG
jgi:hypothetical protein